MITTIYPKNAKILFVTGHPSERDAITGKALHPDSASGRMFAKLLENTGLSRHEVGLATVMKDKAPGGRESYFFEDHKTKTTPKPILQRWMDELQRDIKTYKPNIIVPLGDTATRLLTGETKITEARGYIMPCTLDPDTKVIPTYDPYTVTKQWSLGFTTIMDYRKAARHAKTKEFPPETRALNPYPSASEFMEYIDYLKRGHTEPISLDIETTRTGHLDILGIGASAKLGMSFTFVRGPKAVYRPETEFQIWRQLAELFKVKSIIMHNGLFDMASMWHYLGVLARGYDKDTMIATHVCWPETPRSLSYLTSICLDSPKWKHTAEDDGAMYNCEDAVNTYGCWDFMAKEMTKGDHWNTFNFEMRQVWVASMLQLQGIQANKEKQKQLIQECTTESEYLYKELVQEIGHEINFNSPVQLQNLLYDELKLPEQYKRRKRVSDPRKRTADAEALNNLFRKTNNPILKKILRYKELTKLTSSFLDIPLSPEGRVHTSYNITGATMQRKQKGLIVDDDEQHQSFGRWSSSKSIIIPYGSGNLQNIPRKARSMYEAPEGKVYIQADYKQAEAVVVSYEILDLPMIKLFKDSFGLTDAECKERNLDIHKLTAARNFKIPIEKVTKELRNIGKTIRHAQSYAAGPKVLANKLGCKLSHAKVLMQEYHNGCPQLKMWHKKIQQLLKKDRTLTNLLGRKHKFLRNWGDDLFRSAYSYIPQSTVGDLLNLALIRLYENYGEEVEIVLQLHDAVYTVAEQDMVDWTCTIMKQCMLIPLTSTHGEQYYIDVDFKVGPSWGEMYDYTPQFTHEIKLDL